MQKHETRRRWLIWATLLVLASLGCLAPPQQHMRAQEQPVEPQPQEEAAPENSSVTPISAAPTQPQAQPQLPSEPAPQAQSQRRDATLSFVWFRGKGSTAEGGVAPMTVRLEPNPSGRVAVGVIEEFSGGAGNMWRSAAWIAAFNATQVLGKRLSDYEFVVKSGGLVDGPSASMLTTATMMALIRGDEILPHTTMTGTINPDGTCGPVGGIVQKLEGAAKAGIRRFAYPIGLRHHVDAKTGQTVDLQLTAKNLGVAVMELHDLYDAYYWLTGVKLERPAQISEVLLEPDVQQVQRMKARNALMLGEVKKRYALVDALLELLPESVSSSLRESFVKDALDTLNVANRWERSGDYEVSYIYIMQAWSLLESVYKQVPLFDFMRSQQADRYIDYLTELQGGEKALKRLETQIEQAINKQTVGGWINTTHALTSYISGLALSNFGQRQLQAGHEMMLKIQNGDMANTYENRIALMEKLLPPAIFSAGAQASAYIGTLQLTMGTEQGQGRPSNKALHRLTSAYRAAASANMAYFDSLIVEPMANQLGISMEKGRDVFGQIELSYALSWQSSGLALAMDIDDEAKAMVALAAAVNAYMESSALIYKYYSLQAQRDPKSKKLVLSHRRALSTHLDAARRRAREAAYLAQQSLGFVPEATKAEYARAIVLRDGEDEDKLIALQSFWFATFWCELAIALKTD